MGTIEPAHLLALLAVASVAVLFFAGDLLLARWPAWQQLKARVRRWLGGPFGG